MRNKRSFMPAGMLHVGVAAGVLASVGIVAPWVRAQDIVTPPAGWHKVEAESSGAAIVLSPDNLAEGKVFTLTIRKPASIGSDSTRDWFSRQIEKDIATLGTVSSNGQIQEQASFDGMTCARAFRDSSGRQLIALYVTQAASGGQARLFRIVSSPEADISKVYTPQATVIMKPFLHRVSTMAGNKSSGSTSGHTATRGGRTGTASSAIKDRRLAYMTQPGSGLKTSQIDGIYSVGRMRAGVGGYFYLMYVPLIALKDGTYYEDFDVPPSEFSVAASRELHPKDWGKWRRVGGKVQTLQKKGWESDNWIGPLKGGSSNERLTGTFSSISGGGNTAYGGGTMIASVRSFTFRPDGHFSGGSATSLSSHEPTSTVGVEAGANRDYDGTYRINGYAIEFRYTDGRVDRRSFVFMDEKKKDAIYLNGTVYLKDEKSKK